jgi:membrane dipeptidase
LSQNLFKFLKESFENNYWMVFMKDFTIIDGHTDVLLALTQQRRKFYEESEKGHVDLPRMKKANVGAAFFAIWPGINQYYILKGVRELLELVNEPKNKLMFIKNYQDFNRLANDEKVGVIFHIEGIGGFDSEFHLMHILYQLGLRSFGITWSDSNLFGTGSSFDPNAPIDTRGLTAEGQALVEEANELGIVVDVSHLSDKSFWDVLEVTSKPIIASHSSCRAIGPHVRNLTDEMIEALAQNGGVMGINFGNSFLRPDSQRLGSTPASRIIEHIEHVVELVGIDHVAFGSDFDGTSVPDEIGDCTGFNLLRELLEEKGYSKKEMNKICHGNFMRVFKEVWK